MFFSNRWILVFAGLFPLAIFAHEAATEPLFGLQGSLSTALASAEVNALVEKLDLRLERLNAAWQGWGWALLARGFRTNKGTKKRLDGLKSNGKSYKNG